MSKTIPNDTYNIVMDADMQRFEDRVSAFLSEGWALAGGLQVTHNGSRMIFYQAVVMRHKPNLIEEILDEIRFNLYRLVGPLEVDSGSPTWRKKEDK